MLEPMNNFLYTWTFLDTLENEQKGNKRKGCKAFRLVSIFLVPTVYILVFSFLIYCLAKSELYLFRGESASSIYFDDISAALFKALGYWSTITNLVSCVILALVIRFVRRITSQPIQYAVSLQSEELQAKVGLNTAVTATHIVIITAYTAVLFVGDNFESVFSPDTIFRLRTCLIILSVVLDIFIAYMMWFMMDEDSNTPSVVRDENVEITY